MRHTDVFGIVLGQHFGHDSALDERSQGISDMSLHIISPRIFLDGSSSGLELWCGHFLVPSWEKGVSSRESEIGRTSIKIQVLTTKLPISGNVTRPAGSVLRAFPASHGPYGEKSENQETHNKYTISRKSAL